MTKRYPRLQLPNEATSRHAATVAQHHQQSAGVDSNIGNPTVITDPNPAPGTNAAAPGATLAPPSASDHTSVAAPVTNAARAGHVVAQPNTKCKIQLGRNRASPARLVKLNKLLLPAQKALVIEWGWGGMLMVKATEMPVYLSMWVLSCFDPIISELAILGRGSILVDADSYHKVFELTNDGLPVRYEMETDPISFMNEEYNILGGSAPEFKDWCKMIKGMEGVADMKFLRAYFAAVIRCFISPTTKCSISPRCYPSIVDLNIIARSNWCQFAIDQIIMELKKMGVKKKSVCCCLQHLVTLYLDSLEVDEHVPSNEDCHIHATAWDDKLIQAVMRKDLKPNGEFGKLRMKDGVGVTIRDRLFVWMTRIEEFVQGCPNNFHARRKARYM